MDDALRSVNLLSVGNELVGGYRCVMCLGSYFSLLDKQLVQLAAWLN